MNVLITGSTGFLGKEVSLALKKKKFNIKYISRKRYKSKNYIYCNLNNVRNLKHILNNFNANVIVNLAAKVDFSNKFKNIYKINTHCPYEIAKICKKKKIHLIQASSILINGQKRIYGRRTKYNPINHYEKSKLKAEFLIRKTKCNYTILRFGGIYGKNGPEHLGINKFIKLGTKGKKLIFEGNEKSLRNYIFVEDAANFIINCIENKKYGIFYVGGQIISFEKMLKNINKTFCNKNEIIFSKNFIKKNDQIIKTDKSVKFTSFKNSLKLLI